MSSEESVGTGEWRPPSRRMLALAAVAVLLVFGILRFLYFYLGSLAEGDFGESPLPAFINEMTGSVGTIVVFAFLVPFVRRFPVNKVHLWPRLGLHLVTMMGLSAAETTFYWGSRSLLYPLAGLQSYDYGILSYRYPMEASNFAITYIFMVIAIQAWFLWEEGRRRQIREARLEARLTQARLEGLQAQLQPHFLFNTLNTISSVMYRSPEEADRIVSRLGDLLRIYLASPDTQLVSVEEELDALRVYLEIIQARFPHRLRWDVDLAQDARGALVPRLLLQPLVENAVKHGVAASSDAGSIRVSVRRDGALLQAEVEDDGPGLPGDGVVQANGVGLRNTRERLHHLYGEAGALDLADREPRGVRAVVSIPFQEAQGGDGA